MYYKFEKRSKPFTARECLWTLSPIPHIHPHLELIYLTEGSGRAIADNYTEILNPGDLYFAFPNQIHYYDAVPVNGILVVVAPELFPDLMDIFSNKLPKNPIIRKESLPTDTYSQLQKICDCIQSADTMGKIAATGYLQGLLAELLTKMTLLDIENNHDSVRDILVYCLENYKEPLTLDHLAQELHLSKYYISHIFTDRLSISFPDFINGLRIESACRRLDKGKDITDVAFESGFNSIRSFNRNFKRSIGITPSEYIKHRKTICHEKHRKATKGR